MRSGSGASLYQHRVGDTPEIPTSAAPDETFAPGGLLRRGLPAAPNSVPCPGEWTSRCGGTSRIPAGAGSQLRARTFPPACRVRARCERRSPLREPVRSDPASFSFRTATATLAERASMTTMSRLRAAPEHGHRGLESGHLANRAARGAIPNRSGRCTRAPARAPRGPPRVRGPETTAAATPAAARRPRPPTGRGRRRAATPPPRARAARSRRAGSVAGGDCCAIARWRAAGRRAAG